MRPSASATEAIPATRAVARLPSRLRAHVLLGLLMFTAVFAYADMQLFALLANRIKTDFGISDTELGAVQGLALNLSMAAALVPAGLLADRFSRVSLLMGSAALWSVFTLLTGLSGGYWQLFLCRIGVGVAEAAVYPAAYSLIADLYAPRHRALAVSIFLAGALAGAGLATALSGKLIGAIDAAVATHAGGIWDYGAWRLTFMVVALPGVALLIALAMMREPARREDGPVEQPADTSQSFLGFLGQERGLLGRLIGAIVLSQLGMFSMLFWLPSAFTRMFGFAAGQAGEWFGSIFGMGSLSGIAMGAALVSLVRRRNISSAPLVVFRLGVGLAALAVLFLPFSQTPRFLAAAAAALVASVYMGIVTAPTILMAIAPNHLRARVVSLQTLTVMGATAVTPPLVGALSDHLFSGPRGLVLALGAVAIPCNLLAPVVLIGIGRLFNRTQTGPSLTVDCAVSGS